MMRNRLARLLAIMLCFCLLAGSTIMPTVAFATDTDTMADADTKVDATAGDVLESPEVMTAEAQPEEDAVLYVGVATIGLKVRREPDKDALGNGSIAEGELVYIIERGDEWTKVHTGRNVGYVLTQYIKDVRPYSELPGLQGSGSETSVDATPTETPDTSANNPSDFEEKFVAYAYKTFVARKGMDDKSGGSFKVPKYDKVTVGAVHDGWSYIKYKNSYGYVENSSLFKWDRIDPYAGDIPGMTVHTGLAFLNHTTDIRSYVDKNGEVLKTVNAGTAISVDDIDENGRYPLPYWRTTGYVNEADVSYVMKVVPWDEAESGDLISCMSTFYAVGVHTLQYQGRNYNIYLATSFLSGLVVQPGELIDTHDVMGPYRKSTGYHKAPIMSPTALWGYGGGTCQVNTTLYNALIQVPIYINWRKVHAEVGIYYCPVGFDAAVGGGDITMRFTNTLPYAVRVNFFMSDGCLTVGIFRV